MIPLRTALTPPALDLGADARAVVTGDTAEMISAWLGSTDAAVRLYAAPDVLRGLLTDALAQLDAIAPAAEDDEQW